MEGEVTVRDVMTRDFVGVSESDSVLGAVQLMDEEGVGCVVVLRGTEPVGIMTESDVIGFVADGGDPAETEVATLMSDPVVSVNADRALTDATGTMSREDIRRLVVTNDGELVGVLSERDVISASASLSTVPTFPDESPREVGDRVRSETLGSETLGATAGNTEAANEYSDRSICEVCGTLSRELANVNGQLICADCREV